MNENDTTRDFHDELLSAYLDGELSPGEQARVEERLAVDPDARHVLDELRSVSQAVQSLPQESLGEDLRASILERAQRTMPAAASSNGDTTSQSDAPFPRLTIGRTARGWTWAALAVAAALMIMFLEPGADPDDKAREVAAVDADGRDAANRDLAIGAAEWRAAGEEMSELGDMNGQLVQEREGERWEERPSNELVTTGQSEQPTSRESLGLLPGVAFGGARPQSDLQQLEREVASGTAAPLDTLSRPRDEAINAPGQSSRSLVRGEGAGAAGDGGALTLNFDYGDDSGGETRGMADVRAGVGAGTVIGDAETPAPPNDWLLVYVNVKPEALASRTIDQQLLNCGIVLESPPARPDGETAAASGRGNYLFYRTDVNEELGRLNRSEPNAIDAILIDAPAPQIIALLSALNSDTQNVVDIRLDDAQLADKEAQVTQLAVVDWSRFDRVSVPEGLRQRGRTAMAEPQQENADVGEPTGTNGRGRVGRGGRGRGARTASGGGRGGRAVVTGGGRTPALQPTDDQQRAGRGQSSTSEPSSGELASTNYGAGTGTASAGRAASTGQLLEARRGGSSGPGLGRGGFGGGGGLGGQTTELTDAQPPIGRASRILLAPQPVQPTSEVDSFYGRGVADRTKAQLDAAGTDAATEPTPAARESATVDQPAAERNARPQRQVSVNRGLAWNAEAATAGHSFQALGEGQGQRGPSIQVLLVLRAAPDLAAPAAARPAPPPTSPPAGDRAK